jgi:hypothetical protein
MSVISFPDIFHGGGIGNHIHFPIFHTPYLFMQIVQGNRLGIRLCPIDKSAVIFYADNGSHAIPFRSQVFFFNDIVHRRCDCRGPLDSIISGSAGSHSQADQQSEIVMNLPFFRSTDSHYPYIRRIPAFVLR